MKQYFAPRTEVRMVTNTIRRMLKKIDTLWEKQGMGSEEMVFWSQNRSVLHNMHDDIVRKYKVVRKMTY